MPATKYFGSHFFWAPAGAGSSKTQKPGSGAFVKIGAISRLSLNPQSELRMVEQPTPGLITRTDVIPVKFTLDFSATLIEVGPVFWQLGLGCGAVPASGDAIVTIGSSNGAPAGWAKIQEYDSDNNLKLVADMFCRIVSAGDITFDDNAASLTITGHVISTVLNVGELKAVD